MSLDIYVDTYVCTHIYVDTYVCTHLCGPSLHVDNSHVHFQLWQGEVAVVWWHASTGNPQCSAMAWQTPLSAAYLTVNTKRCPYAGFFVSWDCTTLLYGTAAKRRRTCTVLACLSLLLPDDAALGQSHRRAVWSHSRTVLYCAVPISALTVGVLACGPTGPLHATRLTHVCLVRLARVMAPTVFRPVA
jgi:hypothetical protein